MSSSRLQLVARLGRSATTELHLCRLRGVEGFTKEVILKRLVPERAGDLRAVRAFLDEARVAARISHPNIVAVFEVGDSDEGPYAAMEYVRGVSLALVSVRAHQARNVHHGHIAQLMARLCDAVIHAQASQRVGRGGGTEPAWPRLVLREVNAGNALVTAEGTLKLLDLGMTAANETAPNRGHELFVLGVALYELTSGVHPFGPDHGRGPEAAGRAARGQYSRPSLLIPDYPRELERVVLAAIDGRLTSIRELRDRLEELAATPALRSTPNTLADWLGELFPDFSALTRTSGWAVPAQTRTSATHRVQVSPPPAVVEVATAARPAARREFDLGGYDQERTPPGPVAMPRRQRRLGVGGPRSWQWLALGVVVVAAGGVALAVMRTPEPPAGPAVARASVARPVLGTPGLAPEPAPEPEPPARIHPARVREHASIVPTRVEPPPAPRAARPAPIQRPSVERARPARASAGSARQYALAAPPPAPTQAPIASAPAPEPEPPEEAPASAPPPPVAPAPAADPAPRPASVASTVSAPVPPRPSKGATGGPIVSGRPRAPRPAPARAGGFATYSPDHTARVCKAVELSAVHIAGVSPEYARGLTAAMRRSLRDQAPIYPIAMYYFIVREAGLQHDSVTAAANLAAAQANGAILRFKDLPGIERDIR